MPFGQLTFPFPQAARFAEGDFVESATNAEARAWLADPEGWPNRRLVLTGDAGAGKTHLLHLWAMRRGAPILEGGAVSGFAEMPAAAAMAIDDADRVEDPVGLLHRLNLAALSGTAVLLTARSLDGGFALPDLASRMRASGHAAIRPPDDALFRALLARFASDRQLILSDQVSELLLCKLPRTTLALRAAVAMLDRASLVAGGGITRILAARVAADISARWNSADAARDNPMIIRSRLPLFDETPIEAC